MEKVIYKDFSRIAFSKAWNIQTKLLNGLVERKRAIRRGANVSELDELRHYLLFCEHNPVYTLGKSGSEDHLLLDEKIRSERSIEYFKINRGGDITYHGPGQLTGYPILDLDEFFTDLHKYVRLIEEAIIQCIDQYGLKGVRLDGYTGVWIHEPGHPNPWRKICAIGVHLSRWVTMHGFALNINTDLNYFNNIIPCGINDADKSVTSISNELGKYIDMNEVKLSLKSIFADLFDYQYVDEKLTSEIL